MRELTPTSGIELAEALREASAAGQTANVRGAGSKRRMGGAEIAADLSIMTSGLTRVLQYEPRDLTLSVQAGLPWRELTRMLGANRQMIPLDPPCAEQSTVGGVIMTNSSGPRRRLYGAARDMVIGMTYATAEGALADTGGMVVKNVAGLDVQKALIGSFGTLAAVTVVNFKLAPLPEATRTFVTSHGTAQELCAARDRMLAGALQPAALDALSPRAAAGFGLHGHSLVVRAGGPEQVLARYARELAGAELYEGDREVALWRAIEEFAPARDYVVRVGHALGALQAVFESQPDGCASVARAGTGVSYLAFETGDAMQAWMGQSVGNGWSMVVEWSRGGVDEYWPSPGVELEWMRKLKAAFDPNNVLNRGRLYGRI